VHKYKPILKINHLQNKIKIKFHVRKLIQVKFYIMLIIYSSNLLLKKIRKPKSKVY
jgi:hypothetical protein